VLYLGHGPVWGDREKEGKNKRKRELKKGWIKVGEGGENQDLDASQRTYSFLPLALGYMAGFNPAKKNTGEREFVPKS